MSDIPSTVANTTLKTALSRGLRRRCPACGEGPAFKSYLKIADACTNCQAPLGTYPTDDGPAYVTMLLVGHLIVAPMFMFEFFWVYPLAWIATVMVVGMGALTVGVLPFVKGAWLGLMWHLGMKRSRRPGQ
jgi:uncharacterized protein (DUF983 family)